MLRPPTGVVLAGGEGRRMGGDKALATLDGIPLLRYPLEVLRQVFGTVAVAAKSDSRLPRLDASVTLLLEPPEPRHPLVGVRTALAALDGPVFVCPVDVPLLDEATVRHLWAGAEGSDVGAVARAEGSLHPLVGLFLPAALPGLVAMDPDEPARDVVGRLGLAPVDVPRPEALRNVNAPEDLLMLAEGFGPRRHPAP